MSTELLHICFYVNPF